MTASVVDAAPAPASECPIPQPTTGIGHSEAIILCAVLAEHAPTLPCATDADTGERLHKIVRRVLMHLSHAEVLDWRTRLPGVTGQEWAVRWDAARRAAQKYWPSLPGVKTVPDLYALDEASVAWGGTTAALPTRPS